MLGLALGLAVPFLAASHLPNVRDHTDAVGDLLLITGALFGLLLAGFAIVAALLGDRYTRLLEESGASALQMLRHFIVVGGVLVLAIVLSVAFRMFAAPVADWKPGVEQAALGVVFFTSAWGLFSTLELMKLILGVAVTSTAMHSIDGQGASRRQEGRSG